MLAKWKAASRMERLETTGKRTPLYPGFKIRQRVSMSTITVILDPDADGTVHLPLPQALRGGKVKVEAKLEAVDAGQTTAVPSLWKGFGALKGRIWMSPDF